MGTGGIGGYFGILLARAGNDVHFIARGAQLDAMTKDGPRLIADNEDFHQGVKATKNPQEIGVVDLGLFCVKTYDTENAARAVLPILKDDSSVLTLQNGIENFRRISAVVGSSRVIPGGALIVSEVESPGVI